MSIITPDSLRSVGVRSSETQQAAKHKEFWEEYEALSPAIAREVAEYEKGNRYERKCDDHTAEVLAQLREENVESRRKYRLEMQDELKKDRTGRILHLNQFYLLLKSTGIRPQIAEKGLRPGMLGLTVRPNDIEDPKYICFVQGPFMQEYEEVYFDQFDVPLGPKRRGWRTVLLRLIEAGVLTEAQAHKVFGKPPVNATSRRYLAELHRLRNIKSK